MNDTPPPPLPPTNDDNMRILAYVVYGSFVLAPIMPLVPFIGIVVAGLKYKDAEGTIYQSHFMWVLRTFVLFIGVALVGSLLLLMSYIRYLGMLVMGVAVLWALYRLVKGGLRLIENKPIEDVTALY